MPVLALRGQPDAARCAPVVREHLANGGIIAYPTETVYGFGTALHHDALVALARLKGREGTRPFLLLDAEPLRLPGLEWTPAASLLARRFWPGPLSLALPATELYPPQVRSPAGTVAVRDTPHPPLRALLRRLAEPLTSTSANLPGQPPAITMTELLAALAALPGGEAVLVLDGGSLPDSPPSTVVDCSGTQPRLVRAGAVPLAELRAALAERGFTIDVA
ncbi:MAG: L-threonylcarbamoyladenylate synthase [Gemmatimonadetes bacterium]|nr:L-threonylcarbamoyladenylate synthase [Gemmatimonadota bacterium]